MVCITAFHAGKGGYGVMPSAEYDGDPATIIHEFDPFQPSRGTGHTKRWRNPTQISSAALHDLRLYSALRHGGGGGATVRPFVTEPSTMLVIGLVLSVAGIGVLCWLLFTLAVYALPFFARLTVGLAAFHGDSGVIGAFVVGVLAGGSTLVIGQITFATVRAPLIRAAIALLFAMPAAIAGYHATFGLAHMGGPSEGWCEAFAIVDAVLVGGTAWARMSLFVPPHVDQRGAGGRHRFHRRARPRTGEAAPSLSSIGSN
jgi:hypothetical protein